MSYFDISSNKIFHFLIINNNILGQQFGKDSGVPYFISRCSGCYSRNIKNILF